MCIPFVVMSVQVAPVWDLINEERDYYVLDINSCPSFTKFLLDKQYLASIKRYDFGCKITNVAAIGGTCTV